MTSDSDDTCGMGSDGETPLAMRLEEATAILMEFCEKSTDFRMRIAIGTVLETVVHGMRVAARREQIPNMEPEPVRQPLEPIMRDFVAACDRELFGDGFEELRAAAERAREILNAT